MAAAYFQQADLNLKPEVWFKKWFWAPAFVVFFVLLNILSFSVSTLHGASTQTLWTVHAVNRYFKSFPNTVWLSNRDYLDPLHLSYYDLSAVSGFESHEMHLYQNPGELAGFIHQYPHSIVIIDGSLKDSLTQGFVKEVESSACTLVSTAFPKFLSQRLKVPYQALYSCEMTVVK